MNAAEVIALLSEFPPDTEVVMADPDGGQWSRDVEEVRWAWRTLGIATDHPKTSTVAELATGLEGL